MSISFATIGPALARFDELQQQNPGKKYVIIKAGTHFKVVEKINCISRFFMRQSSEGYYTRAEADGTMIRGEINNYITDPHSQSYYRNQYFQSTNPIINRVQGLTHVTNAIATLWPKLGGPLGSNLVTVQNDLRQLRFQPEYQREVQAIAHSAAIRQRLQTNHPYAYATLLHEPRIYYPDQSSPATLDEILTGHQLTSLIVGDIEHTLSQCRFDHFSGSAENLTTWHFKSPIPISKSWIYSINSLTPGWKTLAYLFVVLPLFLFFIGNYIYHVCCQRPKIIEALKERIKQNETPCFEDNSYQDLTSFMNDDSYFDGFFQRVLAAHNNDWNQAVRFIDLIFSANHEVDHVRNIRFDLNHQRIEVRFQDNVDCNDGHPKFLASFTPGHNWVPNTYVVRLPTITQR